MEIVAFQEEFRPELPNVYSTYDYRIFRDILIKIDEIMTKSNLEHDLVLDSLQKSIQKDQKDDQALGKSKNLNYRYKILRHALRCNIARHLTGESYRLFSLRLADSGLFQWFTGINALGSRKAISKSALERYEKYFDEQLIANKIRNWMSELSEEKKAVKAGLIMPVSFKQTFMDSTCVKANIHYPVDWLLLRVSCPPKFRQVLKRVFVQNKITLNEEQAHGNEKEAQSCFQIQSGIRSPERTSYCRYLP